MIEIDGSIGEGGGQVLRSSLTLSLITGKKFSIKNIRSQRKKTGLRQQHLKAVIAAKKIGNADVTGNHISSTEVNFAPYKNRTGRFKIDIGTAGSTSLIIQTIYLPLGLLNSKSSVLLSGGTHTLWAPCFHYLKYNWLPYLAKLGIDIDLELLEAGYYPRGGGRVKAIFKPSQKILPLRLDERGNLIKIIGVSAFSNLDPKIGHRQKTRAYRRLIHITKNIKISTQELPSRHKGTMLLLSAEFSNCISCFYALGAPGKPAEQVVDEAVDELEDFLLSSGAVDPYLADQLLLPLSIADGPSTYTTNNVTSHLLTNAEVIRNFLPCEIKISGEIDTPGRIEISPNRI